ncbi:DUF6252 family protein [Flavobacterium sp. SM2513]|uniref:DUF6252 family protein n=1 Tax=Flavobacterium sp. SM2513 TaxID=3424766 RepID=UPI003D7F8827
MKTKFSFGVLALFFFATFLSCSSDSDGNSTANASISANIDGQSWSSIQNGVTATVTSLEDEGITKNVLQVIAIKADQSTITLQLPIDSLVEGTYTFDSESSGMLSYSNLTAFSFYSSGAAPQGTFSITISNVNLTQNTISGTFSGTVYDMMDSGDSKQITNGVFQNVKFGTTGVYSNGYMSLSKNNGGVFTMSDANSENSKILIIESSIDNSVNVNGYSLSIDNDFGIYAVTFPKNVTPGTYAITTNGDFKAAYANPNDEGDYTVSNGSITIVSHVGNTVKATFTFTATLGAATVNVSQGELEVTHLD